MPHLSHSFGRLSGPAAHLLLTRFDWVGRFARAVWSTRGSVGTIAAAVFLLGTVAGATPRFAPSPPLRVAPAAPDDRALRLAELPQVLSSDDLQRYRRIFAMQEDGWWDDADGLIAELEDPLLMSYVRAQRYLHRTEYRSTYRELAGWLKQYRDRPQARAIYRLAKARRPGGAGNPPPPHKSAKRLGAPQRFGVGYRSEKKLNLQQRRRVRVLQARIRRHLRNTRLTATEKLLASAEVKRLFDRVQIDDAYAELAAGWFYRGRTEKALDLARAVTVRSGDDVPIAHWTAGLAAWQIGEVDHAVDHFSTLATAAGVSSWNRAAGAYWAARSNILLGNQKQAERWLRLAAEYPRTFYGLLARETLGLETRFNFDAPPLVSRTALRLVQDPAARRALALMRLNRFDDARQELLLVEKWADPAVAEGVFAIAEVAQFPAVGFKLAKRLTRADDQSWTEEVLDHGHYPVPPWHPEGGFTIDRALVFAIMRQESAFNRYAKSPGGARGLMQLMPRTAWSISRKGRYRGRAALYDPKLNIALGQRYITWLLRIRGVKGDLFRMISAYNGGPGNLRKWQRTMKHGGDPLLFIETLPNLENRLYVERVLTNLWIYRQRLGQPAPSLKALAAGEWPTYQALDDRSARTGKIALSD